MTGYTLKLQSKKGQHVVTNLDAGTTIGTLKARISEITQIPQPLLHILVGFPPKPLDLSRDAEILSASGITSGDTLIVEEKVNATLDEDAKLARRLYAEEEESNRIREIENQSNGEFIGILLKKVVPADNSCLFTSIGYVLNGAIDTECGSYMRDIIAEHVASDPDTYNEAMLGKPNAEYCNWIRRPESWGGAIEVSILSSFYGLEIDVVDITNAIINRFGEDKSYGLRVFLLFDGIHYDPLYMESMSDGPPKTIFPIEDEAVYQQAEQLAREAKSSRQFTDVNKFTLRCIQCDALLIGQVEAQQHAISTGHTNFGIHQNSRLISEKNISLDEDEELARSLYEEELEKSQIAELAKQSAFSLAGILLKKSVPADNSCLFTSIGFLLNGTVDTECGACMRDIIAEKVASDPDTYNEAMLAKPNNDYCKWIRRPESWGGAIEISILSNFYALEIDVVDITNAIINRFGEDKNYGLRGFLVFDGIHYDPLYMESIIEGPPKTIFPIENESVYQQAKLLAAEAKLSKQQNHTTLH